VNNKHLVGGIFCDLRKAFDCVSHDTLIKKLEFYGITGKFNALIKSYFKGRYQKVILDKNNSVDSISSRWMEIKFGVPQGSILGPLFFLLYINDITQVSIDGTQIFLYADDASIIVTNPDYNGYKLAMNNIFHEVRKWFKINLLSLNLKRTHYLQFKMINKDDLDMDIGLSHKQIFNSNCTKFLGLIIDNKLSWKNHIDYLTTKLSTTCFIMRVIKPLMSLNTLKMIYFSYIHSVMTYGITSIFWGNSPHSTKVFKIQKKCNKNYHGSNDERFK
jgi:hypothetical protein